MVTGSCEYSDLTVADDCQVAQEFRAPLNGMVGLTMALCKSPALSAPIKKQQLGKPRGDKRVSDFSAFLNISDISAKWKVLMQFSENGYAKMCKKACCSPCDC